MTVAMCCIDKQSNRAAPVRDRQPLGAALATTISLLSAALPAFPAAAASDNWTAVTVGRLSWGAAAAPSLSEAIALAIRDCRSRTARPSDCGAEIKTIRTGYVLAMRCGDYRALVSGDTREDAESGLTNRILQLRYVSNAKLAPCVRILDVQGPASSTTEADVAQSLR
jgi:hypothetical protein